MKSFTKLALLACLALTIAAPRPAVADAVSARLDALERENAALRARLIRLETSKAARPRPHPADAGPVAPLAALPRSPAAADSMASAHRHGGEPRPVAPRFELSGTLSFLQPGAGNLEYGTLTNPLPVVTPHWNNQSLKPNFAPSFTLGARYMPSETNDIQLNWTHLNSTADDAFFASPTEMVGPPYLIGPESALYKNGSGTVKTRFDAVNLDVGHTFCADCAFQMRAFGGVTAARIGQTLSGLFESPGGAASSGYTNNSLFTGAGPRLGLKGQYGIGDFQFIGEVAAAALVGISQGRVDYTTLSPAFGLSSQYLASPNATRVVPSIDARLATAYTFAPNSLGLFKVEAGYKAAVYFDAVNSYAVTQVPTGLTLPPVGIYLATQQHLLSNFTNHGPYVTASWAFW
ncbi:MAG: Lpg1974 family pore-forming outer membrane protein [Bradyrhizobium sp.]|nr:Lpg1974 family pore-forming outer membrane protein [Bradyrhizobium sp.]